MISSVVVKFEPQLPESKGSCLIDNVLKMIGRRPDMEAGTLVDGTSLPITLEAADSASAEMATRWLSELPGVAFVDVAFVYFEQCENSSRLCE